MSLTQHVLERFKLLLIFNCVGSNLDADTREGAAVVNDLRRSFNIFSFVSFKGDFNTFLSKLIYHVAF